MSAELDFIRERMTLAARVWRWEPVDGARISGISSDALALYAIGGQEPLESQYPSDEGDLRACEQTYEMAPPNLQQRMLPFLERYRAHVQERTAAYNEWLSTPWPR